MDGMSGKNKEGKYTGFYIQETIRITDNINVECSDMIGFNLVISILQIS